MTILTPEVWAKVRHDYEHTDRVIEDICLEHGISAGTLRDRMRRWGWTRRQMAVPLAGPPPMQQPTPELQLPSDAPSILAAPQELSPLAIAQVPAVFDKDEIGRRLQAALARVLPAIEATLGSLAANATQPREIERASRALTALTRTLQQLNALASRFPPPDERAPGIEEIRRDIARKIDAIIAKRDHKEASGADAE